MEANATMEYQNTVPFSTTSEENGKRGLNIGLIKDPQSFHLKSKHRESLSD